jgi:hypothetical protein
MLLSLVQRDLGLGFLAGHAHGFHEARPRSLLLKFRRPLDPVASGASEILASTGIARYKRRRVYQSDLNSLEVA